LEQNQDQHKPNHNANTSKLIMQMKNADVDNPKPYGISCFQQLCPTIKIKQEKT
jgi:hypothetical protein